MKLYFKRTVCLLLCAAIAVGGLWYLDRVFRMKRVDGILTMQNFYAQPEGSVDVLLVGNSHSGINVDTATLWSEYGIASYNLWGGVQPLWNSYHFIVEALKYQTPKVIGLEITATISDYEYSEDQNQIKNTAGMKFSKNKIEAVKVSAPEDKWLNLILGFPMYHNRFNELEEKDFQNFPWSEGLENFKGSYLLYGVGNYEFESAEGVTACRDIMDKQEEYLLKIIELCKEKNIPLFLFKSTALERKDAQEIFNTVALIAEENGIDFVNMNLLDDVVGITPEDYSTDRHMNGSGARKVASYLGQYILDNYDVPDRRGEPGFESWDINAAVIGNDYIAAIDDSSDYFTELAGAGKKVFVIKNQPSEDTEDYKLFVKELEKLGIDGTIQADKLSGGQKVLLAPNVEAEHTDGAAQSFMLGGKQLTVNFEYQDIVFGNEKILWFGPSDFVIVVYDEVTGTVADTAIFSFSNRYQLQRSDS